MNQMTQMSDSQALEQLIRDAESLKKTSLKVRLSALRYRVWLVSLREISLIITLLNNFEKIPKRNSKGYPTFTYLLISLFRNHLKMKKLLFNLEKRLRSRIY